MLAIHFENREPRYGLSISVETKIVSGTGLETCDGEVFSEVI
jgi:hypothetical protein